MLAGDRIAHHGEAVMRADAESIEAVEILDAVFERLPAASAPWRSFQVI